MYGKTLQIIFLVLLGLGCRDNIPDTKVQKPPIEPKAAGVSLVVLGTIQDGGSPHPGCKKECCRDLFKNPDPDRRVVSLGIIDAVNKQKWLIEASPDLPVQMKELQLLCDFETPEDPNGIFITHAHIGHYAGLMYLGREAMNTRGTPVYTMPRLNSFLNRNGPWSQLIELGNIDLQHLEKDSAISLASNMKITPFPVPHRDEFSETVGYLIEGPEKSALFIPDIDKWQKWDRDITKLIQEVDYAFLDATFYSGEELGNRDMSEIPHPSIEESMYLFKDLPNQEKNKVYFIHFNHTNPALHNGSKREKILKNGFHIAETHQMFDL